jgi:hypothetical protein
MKLICPLKVAKCLAWRRENLGDKCAPGLVQAMWFVQAMSGQPGGMEALARRLLEASPEWFEKVRHPVGHVSDEDRFLSVCLLDEWPRRPEPRQKEAEMLGDCAWRLARHLPAWLCDVKESERPFAGLAEAVCAYAERHAAEVARSLPETEVRRQVWRELEFARTAPAAVPIVGDSRIGKSTGLTSYCRAWPGRARLVTVPERGDERVWLEAHCEAFGLDFSPGSKLADLRWQVEFIVHRGGLLLFYDEAHYLIPHSRVRTPRRLNWIREHIIDRGLGTAFLATPQSYRQTLTAYADETGYNLEQWDARVGRPVVLPDKLSREDMLRVARYHFPDAGEALTAGICARAMASKQYLGGMERIAKRARFLAAERGDSISQADVQAAAQWAGIEVKPLLPLRVAETLPPPEKLARGSVRGPSAEPLQVPRRGVAPVPQDADYVMA